MTVKSHLTYMTLTKPVCSQPLPQKFRPNRSRVRRTPARPLSKCANQADATADLPLHGGRSFVKTMFALRAVSDCVRAVWLSQDTLVSEFPLKNF